MTNLKGESYSALPLLQVKEMTCASSNCFVLYDVEQILSKGDVI